MEIDLVIILEMLKVEESKEDMTADEMLLNVLITRISFVEHFADTHRE